MLVTIGKEKGAFQKALDDDSKSSSLLRSNLRILPCNLLKNLGGDSIMWTVIIQGAISHVKTK